MLYYRIVYSTGISDKMAKSNSINAILLQPWLSDVISHRPTGFHDDVTNHYHSVEGVPVPTNEGLYPDVTDVRYHPTGSDQHHRQHPGDLSDNDRYFNGQLTYQRNSSPIHGHRDDVIANGSDRRHVCQVEVRERILKTILDALDEADFQVENGGKFIVNEDESPQACLEEHYIDWVIDSLVTLRTKALGQVLRKVRNVNVIKNVVNL